ncbi:MAG TPA: hypothetical protein VF742_12875 [Terracidiphilus sp.]
MPRPPFNLLRACFWLLAAIIGTVLLGMLITTGGCVIAVITKVQPPGTCVNLGIDKLLHDWWAEMLSAVLALLLAARGMPPPGDDDQ